MTTEAKVSKQSAPPVPAVSEPYVGPQSFDSHHQRVFFGRSREAEDIVSLVLAHPVTLIYSPSGAGKTSVINAQVIPLLRTRENCVVWTTRVKGPFVDVDRDCLKNAYMFQALSQLELEGNDGEFPPHLLYELELAEFLKSTPAATDNPEEEDPDQLRVLVIDQFEELFTTLPECWTHREDFFRQVAEALESDPNLRVLFAMREEYLAKFDPFAAILPGRGRNRFALGRLKSAAALDAVEKPAQVFGREFAPGVAAELRDRLMREHAPAGQAEILNEFVEPLQLQVVCRNLWRNLPPSESQITAVQVEKHCNVEQALQRFYSDTIAEVIAERNFSSEVCEYTLRKWFEDELITTSLTRGLVQEENGRVGGMPIDIVRRLENLHLLKVEVRGRGNWYEITHDRFIGPILKDNREWREANTLTVFYHRLTNWVWQHQMISGMAVAVCGLALLAFGLVVLIVGTRESAAKLARSEKELANQSAQFYVKESRSALESPIRDGVDVAGAALLLAKAATLPIDPSTKLQISRRLALAEHQLPNLQAMYCATNLDFGESRLPAISFAPQGRLIIVRSSNSATGPLLLELDSKRGPLKWAEDKKPSHALFSPEGKHVIALRGNALDVYRLQTSDRGSTDLKFQTTLEGAAVTTPAQEVQFAQVVVHRSPLDPHDSRRWWLVTERRIWSERPGTEVEVWSWEEELQILKSQYKHQFAGRKINDAIALCDNGEYLAVLAPARASAGFAEQTKMKSPFSSQRNQIEQRAPAPNREPTVSLPHVIQVIQIAAKPHSIVGSIACEVPCDEVPSLAFRPLHTWPLIFPHRTHQVEQTGYQQIHFVTPSFGVNSPVIRVINTPVTRAQVSPNSDQLLIVHDTVWSLANLNWEDLRRPAPPMELPNVVMRRDLESTIMSEGFSLDGRYLATGSRDRFARIYDLSTNYQIQERLQHGGTLNQVVFSQDGCQLFTNDSDYHAETGTARVWDLASNPSRRVVPLPAPPISFLGRVNGGWELLGSATTDPLLMRFAQNPGRQETVVPNILLGRVRSDKGVEWDPEPTGLPAARRAWSDPTGNLLVLESVDAKTDQAKLALYRLNANRTRCEKVGDLAFEDPDNSPKSIKFAAFGESNQHLVTIDELSTNDVQSGKCGFATVWDLRGLNDKKIVLVKRGEIWRDRTLRALTATNRTEISTRGDARAPLGNSLETELHKEAITSLAVSDVTQQFATGSEDDTGRIWSLRNLTPVAQLADKNGERGHTANVTQVAFRPGKLNQVLTASADGKTKLWTFPDSGSATPQHDFGFGRGVLSSAVFNSNGTLLATAGQDSKVRLWDLQSLNQSNSLTWLGTIHCEDVRRLQFTADSHSLVALCSNYTGNNLLRISLTDIGTASDAVTAAEADKARLERIRRTSLREMGDKTSVEASSITFKKAQAEWPSFWDKAYAQQRETAADWHIRQAGLAEGAGNWNAVNWHLSASSVAPQLKTDRDLVAARAVARARMGILDDADLIAACKMKDQNCRYTNSVLRRLLANEFAYQFGRLMRNNDPASATAKELATKEYEFVFHDSPEPTELLVMGRFAILAGDLRFFDDILQRTLNSDFLHQEKVDTLGLLGETCLSQKRRMSQQAVNAYRLANELAPAENQLAYARCLALIDVVREQLIAGNTDTALDAINEYRAICAKDISQIDESEPETKQSIAWRCLLAAPLTCFPEDPRDRSRLEKAQRVALESLHATESQDLAAKSQRANILGVACYRLGKFDEARTYFEQSEAQLQGDDKEGYLHGVNLLFLTLTHHQLKTAAKDNAQRVELLKDWLRRYLSDANAFQFQEHLELALFQQELIDAGVITQFITPVMDPL